MTQLITTVTPSNKLAHIFNGQGNPNAFESIVHSLGWQWVQHKEPRQRRWRVGAGRGVYKKATLRLKRNSLVWKTKLSQNVYLKAIPSLSVFLWLVSSVMHSFISWADRTWGGFFGDLRWTCFPVLLLFYSSFLTKDVLQAVPQIQHM